MPLRMLPKPIREDDISFAPKQLELMAKPVGLVADVLNNHYADHHRSAQHDAGNYFLHVSDLIRSNSAHKFCPREHAINLLEERNSTRIRQISPGMALIHKMGHGIQDLITETFMERSPHANKLWGNWKCMCGQTHVAMRFREEARAYTCTKCNGVCDRYAEVDLYWREFKIAGHPDFIIVWNNVLHLYEIKTIDRRDVDFETLDAPLGDHTLQASMYYWIIHTMRRIEQDDLRKNPGAFTPSLPFEISTDINYIYADRSNNLFRRQFYKEFTKRASPFSRIQPMLDNAASVKTAVETKRLPPRLSLCTGVSSSRAKNCNCAVSCFLRRT